MLQSHKTQPKIQEQPSTADPTKIDPLKTATETMTTTMEKASRILLGEGDRYRYGPMCMPTVPWSKKKEKLNFYALGEYERSKGN